jgi:sialate O-acetylesterase
MRTFFAVFIAIVVILYTGQHANATIRLPQLVSDGMVLQRDENIKIWGWGEPAEPVKILFNGKTRKTLLAKTVNGT